MLVAQFERLPVAGGYSIERLFRTVRSAFPADSRIHVVQCPTPAHGWFWLPRGIWRAFRSRARVNHIVGDVHYAALGLPGARTILTVHDLNHLDGLTGLRKAIYRWLYFTLPLRRCRVVTAISTRTRDQLVQQFPFVSEKIQVIPDCLPEGFSQRAKTFNSRLPRILQIGARPNKNLERIIEAVSGCSCVLHIVGSLTDEQRNALEQRQVPYENSVDISDAELIGAYEQADLVTFVSLAEGFGMPIIEAQAIGRPVITSNLSPMMDVAGVGACCVDPYSAGAIRAALTRIIQDDTYRNKLVAQGMANVERFQATVVADQYAQLYEEVG